ncbi:hypothetical protein SAMN04489730_3198 [Amycolatopsis australiensis]|uniref:Uncharacterized protein n=1 Tax=Amycolatopsis australiensis TaxID=546364 RepID=A0A1K1RG82_9PSEU|nr:hypothetical protein SAMN04489730_3198 [Amycolatopsis australiensis]
MLAPVVVKTRQFAVYTVDMVFRDATAGSRAIRYGWSAGRERIFTSGMHEEAGAAISWSLRAGAVAAASRPLRWPPRIRPR